MKALSIRRGFGAFLIVMMASAVATAADLPLPARFTAWGVQLGRGGTASLDLTVSRWSTAGDVERLASAFNEGGSDALVQALDKTARVGSFRVNAGLGYDVQFAQITPGPDGGERILAIAERRMGFGEVANMTRSSQYPLTVIELSVNKDGEGSGTMWPIARINYWDLQTRSIIVDNYTWQPIQLNAVRLTASQRS
jgi:hypothetical protein